jgi:predicted N-acetyltransferase YhbS
VTPPAPRRQLAVTRFTPDHAEILAEFYRKVWDPSATADSVLEGRSTMAARNPAAADGSIATVLAILDGAVVGHLTSIPDRVWTGGEEKRVAWLAGFHVLPEHRNGPLGVMVAKEMLRVAPASMTTTVMDAPLRIFTALGWSHVGTVPNQVHIPDPAVVARRLSPEQAGIGGVPGRAFGLLQRLGLAGPLAGAAGSLVRGWSRTAHREGVSIAVHTDIGSWQGLPEADEAWARWAPGVEASLVRDGARLRWRFGAKPGRYILLEAREHGTLVGWIVLRTPPEGGEPRLAGIRLATISDLMFPPDRPGVATALLRGAADHARRTGFAEALLASTPHRETQALLRRQGYLTMAGNLKLVVHPSLLPGEPLPFDRWWHARGDGDADQSF